jgi:hypothetical protein
MRFSLVPLMLLICIVAAVFGVYVLVFDSSEQIPAQTIATLFIGVLGAYIATSQLSVNRQLAQNKNTLDFIFKFDTDKYYVNLRTRWAEIYEGSRQKSVEFEDIVQRLSRGELAIKTTEYMEICDFMTLLDVIAQSIKAKVFNEQIIVSTYDFQLIIYWNGIQPYLTSYRKYRRRDHLKGFEILVSKCRESHGEEFSHV